LEKRKNERRGEREVLANRLEEVCIYRGSIDLERWESGKKKKEEKLKKGLKERGFREGGEVGRGGGDIRVSCLKQTVKGGKKGTNKKKKKNVNKERGNPRKENPTTESGLGKQCQVPFPL